MRAKKILKSNVVNRWDVVYNRQYDRLGAPCCLGDWRLGTAKSDFSRICEFRRIASVEVGIRGRAAFVQRSGFDEIESLSGLPW